MASARVLLPAPRTYAVSPTPTIAYLSRSALRLVASISLGMARLRGRDYCRHFKSIRR